MKKKWTIAAVLVLAVALLAVGTWAYFSAVGRADNVITMGSVKLHCTTRTAPADRLRR